MKVLQVKFKSLDCLFNSSTNESGVKFFDNEESFFRIISSKKIQILKTITSNTKRNSIKSLANTFGITKTKMTKICDELADSGLIEFIDIKQGNKKPYVYYDLIIVYRENSFPQFISISQKCSVLFSHYLSRNL